MSPVRLFPQVAVYVVIMAGAAGLAVLKGFLFAGALATEDFGYYSIFLLIALVGEYLCTLGMTDGLARDYSVNLARGRLMRAVAHRNGVFLGAALVAMSVTVGCLIASRYVQVPEWRAILRFIGPYLLVATWMKIVLIDVRARHKVLLFAVALLAKNAATTLLGLVLIEQGGLDGVLIGETLAAGGVAAFFTVRFIPRAGVRMASLRYAYRLARSGFFFMGTSIVRTTTLQIDRWFAATTLSVTSFAQYSFALLLHNAGLAVTNIVSQYVTPQVIESYGRDGDARAVLRSLDIMWVRLSVAMVALAMPGLVVAYLAVPRLLPEYVSALPLLPIVIAGVIFHAANLYDTGVLAVGRGQLLLMVHISIATATIIACAAIVTLGYDLTGFAAVYSGGRLANLVGSRAVLRSLAAH